MLPAAANHWLQLEASEKEYKRLKKVYDDIMQQKQLKAPSVENAARFPAQPGLLKAALPLFAALWIGLTLLCVMSCSVLCFSFST